MLVACGPGSFVLVGERKSELGGRRDSAFVTFVSGKSLQRNHWLDTFPGQWLYNSLMHKPFSSVFKALFQKQSSTCLPYFDQIAHRLKTILVLLLQWLRILQSLENNPHCVFTIALNFAVTGKQSSIWCDGHLKISDFWKTIPPMHSQNLQISGYRKTILRLHLRIWSFKKQSCVCIYESAASKNNPAFAFTNLRFKKTVLRLHLRMCAFQKTVLRLHLQMLPSKKTIRPCIYDLGLSKKQSQNVAKQSVFVKNNLFFITSESAVPKTIPHSSLQILAFKKQSAFAFIHVRLFKNNLALAFTNPRLQKTVLHLHLRLPGFKKQSCACIYVSPASKNSYALVVVYPWFCRYDVVVKCSVFSIYFSSLTCCNKKWCFFQSTLSRLDVVKKGSVFFCNLLLTCPMIHQDPLCEKQSTPKIRKDNDQGRCLGHSHTVYHDCATGLTVQSEFHSEFVTLWARALLCQGGKISIRHPRWGFQTSANFVSRRHAPTNQKERRKARRIRHGRFWCRLCQCCQRNNWAHSGDEYQKKA